MAGASNNFDQGSIQLKVAEVIYFKVFSISCFQNFSWMNGCEMFSNVSQNSLRGEMITWPKFSWSKLCFFSWSKLLIMNLYKFDHLIEFFETFQLIESSNNGILLILSFKKISINCQNPSVLFCQLVKTFINVILSYFNQLPKKNWRILAVDRMYCWLRNRAKN